MEGVKKTGLLMFFALLVVCLGDTFSVWGEEVRSTPETGLWIVAIAAAVGIILIGLVCLILALQTNQ